MSKKVAISSGSKWEEQVGYSRLVKTGNIIEVAGTTAVDKNGNIVGKGNSFKQTIYIFEKIKSYLEKAGASLADVTRTRMYVANIEEWEAIGQAHHKVFKDIKPVATMVEVGRLIDPELLIEIEVTAYLTNEPAV
jgi:enamine deaminase RidA (YjgF/YER057c/UK114 family)